MTLVTVNILLLFCPKVRRPFYIQRTAVHGFDNPDTSPVYMPSW